MTAETAERGRADIHPLLPVVLVHWRAPGWCHAAVESLAASVGVDARVCVVNNGGTLPTLPESVTVLNPGRNLGFAGGVNFGLRHIARTTRSPVFAFASHDSQVAPGSLQTLMTVAGQHPEFGIVAPWFTEPAASRVGELGRLDNLVEFEWVSGACMLVRRSALEQAGLLDEDFGSYVEDKEFCLRARRFGWRVGAVPSAHASHRGSADRNTALVMMQGNELLFDAKCGRWSKAGRGMAQLAGKALRSVGGLIGRCHRRQSMADLVRYTRTLLFAMTQVSRWAVRGFLGYPVGPPTLEA